MNYNIWDYYYDSPLAVDVCMLRIEAMPREYFCDWGTALWYQCERITDGKMLVTFTGGQFRKAKNTQYILEFTSQDNGTLVHMRFIKDLFSMSPLTLVTDIDLFMMQKLEARRLP
ncbi:MAG: hypothetical protein IKC09_10710 [Oscillospiraceae bacterium]|nr:hypothetical protein [Oscillospiraceae bacterium]